MFHPDGQAFVARVDAIEADGVFANLGRRLAGGALARFSGALWRHGYEHLDVLGVALRFRDDDPEIARTLRGDQDLLFATIRSPFTMPFAPLTTNAHDYLDNRYWAVSPFDVQGVGRAKFRLSLVTPAVPSSLPREERLESTVASDLAVWRIEARRTFSFPWLPVATLTLKRVAKIDQEALRFSPFHSGRGIVPRGLVHAIRKAAYDASQDARPEHRERATPARASHESEARQNLQT